MTTKENRAFEKAFNKPIEGLTPKNNPPRRDCRICGGDGYVSEPYKDTQATNQMTTECPGCKGTGKEPR
jgi:DnaJ-class molecular chaperone